MTLYLHPLAYLLGLEGVALLRAQAGEHGRDFVQERLAEVRALLAHEDVFSDGSEVPPMSTSDGYDFWAPSYDAPGNALIDAEQPIVREMIDALPTGHVLDAACGTGRHTEYLVTAGHRVTGVDASPQMLARAKAKVPSAEFHLGDLGSLPFPDAHFDAIVCALALTHVDDLAAQLTEFARVLRPGGYLITSDAAALAGGTRAPIVDRTPDGAAGYMPHTNRTAGDYIRAGLVAGLDVRRCEEPRGDGHFVDPAVRPSEAEMLAHDPPNIWWLLHWYPEATNAALKDLPLALIWLFQRPGVTRV